MYDPHGRRGRSRSRVRWLLASGLVLGAIPPLAFASFGLWRGHDVLAGFRSLVQEHTGTTIDPAQVPWHPPVAVQWLGNLWDPRLTEVSGLASSPRFPDRLWAINDSGNAHDVFALDERGTVQGRVRLDGSRLGDWEDLDAFELDGRSYLLVGDVGDNYAWRRVLELHVIEEPAEPRDRDPVDPVEVAWTVRFTYPGGPVDCEALAVDERAETVLLLSKRTIPSVVYRVPLRPADPAQVWIAERVAALDTLPQPDEAERVADPEYGQYRSQPTALDLVADLAVVVTYGDAYLFRRSAGEGWADAFARVPLRLALPIAPQREAAALSRDARHLYVTSERGRRGEAGLYRVELGLDTRPTGPAEPPASAPAPDPESAR